MTYKQYIYLSIYLFTSMPTVTSRFSTHISRVTDGCEKEIAMGPITVCEKGSLQKK